MIRAPRTPRKLGWGGGRGGGQCDPRSHPDLEQGRPGGAVRTAETSGTGPWLPGPSSPSEPWGLRAARPAGDVHVAAPSRNRQGLCCTGSRRMPTCGDSASGERQQQGHGWGSHWLPRTLCTARTAPHGQELPRNSTQLIKIHELWGCGLHTSGQLETLSRHQVWVPRD